MGTCCYYYQLRDTISKRDAHAIQVALEHMMEIHSEPLPPAYPVAIPNEIRSCTCSEAVCTCPIDDIQLVRHILRTIEHRTYTIKGSTGYHHSSMKLAYLLYLAQSL
jgi:hypothetical protein